MGTGTQKNPEVSRQVLVVGHAAPKIRMPESVFLLVFFRVEREAEPVATALGVVPSLALGTLGRSFERPEPTDFLENPLAFEFVLQALECAIDGFSFFDGDFWHVGSDFLRGG